MPIRSGQLTPTDSLHDHRVESAQKKREKMLGRILDATAKVFRECADDTPVIEDVVREAQISRGTFYKYFDSLDEALVAAGVAANQRMIGDITPLYDCLNEPWQRSSVGFRLFLVRAWQDPSWAAFVTRMDAWPHNSLISIHMSHDLARGKELGQFHFNDLEAANDFLMGASAGCIQALMSGVADPHAYIDAAVRMLLQSLNLEPALLEHALNFSREHLSVWVSGQRSAWTQP